MSLYDINKTFIDNWRTGPQLQTPLPVRQYPPQVKWHDWLGFKIMSHIGIAACPIMTGKGIALMSQLGFDIFTYKTIRSSAHPVHHWPNIKYVNLQKRLTLADLNKSVYATEQAPESPQFIAITNSFGNNCLSHETVRQDIIAAKQSLRAGQVLIVSVYGEKDEQRSQLEDYVCTACFAKECGADIIEANISCPNLHLEKSQLQNSLFSDKDYFYQFISAIVLAIKPTPLLIKLGLIADDKLLRQILITAARAGAAGVTGINSISMQVKNNEDNPVFGEQRQLSGVSGFPIKQLGLDFIQRVHKIKAQEKLDISVVGVGGITRAEHFKHYHQSGAEIAMSATGAMWNPYLGMDYQDHIHEEQKNEQARFSEAVV